MNDNQREEIKQKMVELYNRLKEESTLNNEEKNIQSITYYEDLTLVAPKGDRMGLAEQDVFSVKIITKDDKEVFELYTDQGKIADIDENGVISFSEEYMEMLSKDPRVKEILEKANNKEIVKLPDEELEEIKDENSPEQIKMEKEELDPEEKEKVEEEEKGKDDEEKIAQTMGLKKEDVSSCVTIKPDQIMSKGNMGENETFEDVAKIEKGKYEKIYVIRATDGSDNKRFSFIGITKDGVAEKLDNIQTRGTTITERKVYSINRDGSRVEEKQVSEMFTMSNSKDKQLSVNVGQYGTIEVNYLRKDPNENKYIGSQVETEYVRPTKTQVQEYMSETKNSKYELDKSIEQTEKQIEENETETTNLSQIDDDKENDKGYDLDEKVRMYNGTETTLREQAQAKGVLPNDYLRRIQEAEGASTGEKILNVNLDIDKEYDEKEREQEEHDSHEERERETPEEAALRRLYSGSSADE